MKMNKLFAVVAALVLTLTMAACKEKVVLAGEVGEDGNSRTYTADRCKGDGMAMTNFTVEEGQSKVLIHCELSKGTLHVTLTDMPDVDAALESEAAEGEEPTTSLADELTSGDAIISYDAAGTADESFEVEPGDYALTVTGDDKSPATGTLSIKAE